jgi:predicted transcriptional regulator
MDKPMPENDPQLRATDTREQRLAREARLVAEARPEAAAGKLVSLESVHAWVDRWGSDHELSLPEPGE